MIDDLTEWESGYGRLIARHDGNALILTWSKTPTGPVTDAVDTVRFDPDAQLLRVFPRTRLLGNLHHQFKRVRELQLDTAVYAWDAEDPIGESRFGEPQLDGMPAGFGSVFAYGLGLLPPYQGIVDAIESSTDCDIVRFGAPEDEGKHGNVFCIGLERFAEYKHAIDLNRDRGRVVIGRLSKVEASNAIADLVGKPHQSPSLGRHPTIQAITRAVAEDVPLDTAERSALVGRMAFESKQAAAEDPQAFGQLRQDIELVALEVLIEQFGNGLHGAMAKDEDKWQAFFETNTFALQQLFAAPVALYGKQLHLRMTNTSGGGGRIADFVLVNTLTQSAVVVEIKTPATRLLGPVYRGAGGAEVYPAHSELAGAIAQLQAQMESVVTDFRDLLRNTTDAEPIETTQVRGAVIAGRLASLDREHQLSFTRYRNGLHGIEVLTFDEVHDRLKGLHTLLADPAAAPENAG